MNDVDDVSEAPVGNPISSPSERPMLEVTDESSPETGVSRKHPEEKEVEADAEGDDEEEDASSASVVDWNWGNDGDNGSIGSNSKDDDASDAMEVDEDNGASDPLQTTPTKVVVKDKVSETKKVSIAGSKDAGAATLTIKPSVSGGPTQDKLSPSVPKKASIEKNRRPMSPYRSPYTNAKEQPKTDHLVASTERLFLQLDNYDNVSVIDIVRTLEPEFGVAFSKDTVRIVRQHLKHLIQTRLEEVDSDGDNNKVADMTAPATANPGTIARKGEETVKFTNLDAAFSQTIDDCDKEEGSTAKDSTVSKGEKINDKTAVRDGKESAQEKSLNSEVDSDDDDFSDSEKWETQQEPSKNPNRPKVSTQRMSSSDSDSDDSDDHGFSEKDDLETQEMSKPADSEKGSNDREKENSPVKANPLEESKSDCDDDDSVTPMSEERDGDEADGMPSKAAGNTQTTKSDSPVAENEPPTPTGTRRSDRIKTVKSQPSEDELVVSIDQLFLQVENKETVTVKDIVNALQVEFDIELTKDTRRFVRTRLTDLITGEAEPSIDHEEEQEEPSEAEISEQGDSESDESAYEEKSKRSKKGASRRKGRSDKVSRSKPKPKRERPNKRAAAKAARAARLVQAERLKKRRMEELRVRQEEMQLTQSKEDQERNERIRAKFDTDTEELRLRRLEGRLSLLQRLDKKRIHVINVEKEDGVESDKKSPLENGPPVETEAEDTKPGVDAGADNTDDSDSSDDEELVIVGAAKPFKPLPQLHNQNQKSKLALSILDRGVDPKSKKAEPSTSERKWASDKPFMSPNKNLGARAALRNSLRRKQRDMGNRWLARELGYKNEEDHVKDCLTLAHKKQADVMKMEQSRLQANERKQLRERLMLEDQQEGEDEAVDFEGGNEVDDDQQATELVDEEDEELELAKEIQRESQVVASSPGQPDRSEAEDSSDEKDGGNNGSEIPVSQSDQERLDIPEGHHEASVPLCDSNDSQAEDEGDHLETQPPTKNASDSEAVVTALPEGDSVRVVSRDSSQRTESQDSTTSEESEKDVAPSTEESASSGTTISGPKTTQLVDSDDDEDEQEFGDDVPNEANDQLEESKESKPRNAGWQAMLRKEAEKAKKLKKRKGANSLVEAEAEEEEEVAGLEDFGFKIHKKKEDDDDEEGIDDEKLDEEDLKHVVDDVSDNEGDEEAGEAARKRMEHKEEKERHKEILRRMREGYDGRRGGIAGGGLGARGMHRFDQLVAADNREDAKRLGLLNDDELDSDDEGGKTDKDKKDDEEEDEAALLDKMLKDRFLHRSSIDLEETFSSDEEPDDEKNDGEKDILLLCLPFHGAPTHLVVFLNRKWR